MNFSKYVGSGNDFIFIDNRSLTFLPERPLVSKLCHRQLGVGADGVILLENSPSADFKMRIFNADGSEAEMCGNGIRCLFHFIQNTCPEENRSSYLIETMESLLRIEAAQGGVKVEMPNPYDVKWGMKIDLLGEQPVHYLNTGVPHAIIFMEDLAYADLACLAPKIRHHAAFGVKGTNVNFVALDQGDGELSVRTYERGVEQETLACGTGVTASALAAAQIAGCASPIKVRTKSGEVLEIAFRVEDGMFRAVTMTGPARHVFSGQVPDWF